MCGIAGILNQAAPKDAAKLKEMASSLKAMQESLIHRGPDNKGAYFSECKQAALTHTRLSIIDLSEKGHQPMSMDDGRYTITFNGEIYNYKKLRTQLEENGEKFTTSSDTEVILKLFIQKGPKCVHNLRGMFAFMIWDNKEKTGFAARDAFGIKPFYYLNKGGQFAFASEIRALISSGLSSQYISSKGVNSYLLRGAVTEPETIIRDIKMLPSGSHLQWQNGSIKVTRYWKPKFESQNHSDNKSIEITRTALEHSVRAHLVSDVPIGLFLSGGIDSTVLVALATKLSRKKINTYSIAFEDPQWNEGDIAKKVADHFGTNHTEFLMTAEKAKPLYETYLKSVDQPSIDGFNTYCIAKVASENGEKVVLSGIGGDEIFAGYKSFDVIPEMMQKTALASKVSFAIKPIFSFIEKRLSAKYRRIGDALLEPESISAAYQSLRGVFSKSESKELTEIICNKESKITSLIEPNHATLADNICHLEMTSYMCNQLLRDSDVASMAWGVELRVPFVDRVLFEQVSSIPAIVRLQLGKQLLVDCVPEIPDWVVERPKQGFRFPFDDWFSNEWNDTELPKTPKWITLDPWYRRWSLAVLNDWKSRHVKEG